MKDGPQLCAAAESGTADAILTLIAARANIDERDKVSDGAGTDVAAFLNILVICLKMAVV